MSDQVEVQVGNIRFSMPALGDHDLMSEAVSRVKKLLEDIENRSDRIDTPRFAVQAAVILAAECVRLELEQEKDQRDFQKTLDRIGATLEKLADEAPGDPGPESTITPMTPRHRA
jgi:cell division protein ZapA (FtsZ GTPase activity inhibitor)